MTFPAPIPFHEALGKLASRQVVGTILGSHQWREAVSTQLRERAFFSAKVDNTRVLQTMRDYIQDFLSETRDPVHGGLKAQGRAEFVANMRELCLREGLGKVDPVTGLINPEINDTDVTDIRSIARLQLIFDTQTEAANEYGYWSQGNTPALLHAFPASRFIRVRPVIVPRSYHAQNEGTVRRKDDLDFWLAMNPDFGVPWGPWGFNSGMGTEDVPRREAIALGLIRPDEEITPPNLALNHRLSASTRPFDPAIRDALQHATGGTPANNRLTPRTTPSTPAPTPSGPESTSPSEALTIAGISPQENITLAQAEALIEELREATPTTVTKISAISRAQRVGVLTKTFIHDTVKDVLSFIPPNIVDKLPDFKVVVSRKIASLGTYDKSLQVLTLSAKRLLNENAARKTIFHEMMHWLHDHTPEVNKRVIQLWNERTMGQILVRLDAYSVPGYKDHWADAIGDEYAGRVYSWEIKNGNSKGTEVLTRHLEKLSAPKLLVKHWNFVSPDGKYHWREAFITLLQNLYE